MQRSRKGAVDVFGTSRMVAESRRVQVMYLAMNLFKINIGKQRDVVDFFLKHRLII